MFEHFFRFSRPGYPHPVSSELDIRTQWALSWKIVASEWRSVIAVSLNVGDGKTLQTQRGCRVCAAVVPYRWATRGKSLREYIHTHTHTELLYQNWCPQMHEREAQVKQAALKFKMWGHTTVYFCPIYKRGTASVTSCLSLDKKILPNLGPLLKERTCSYGSKFLPLRVDIPLTKEAKMKMLELLALKESIHHIDVDNIRNWR